MDCPLPGTKKCCLERWPLVDVQLYTIHYCKLVFCFACSADEQNTTYLSCQNKLIYSIDKGLFLSALQFRCVSLLRHHFPDLHNYRPSVFSYNPRGGQKK